MGSLKPRRPMTDIERRGAEAIAIFAQYTTAPMLVRHLVKVAETAGQVTDGEIRFLWHWVRYFRRYVKDAEVTAEADRFKLAPHGNRKNPQKA